MSLPIHNLPPSYFANVSNQGVDEILYEEALSKRNVISRIYLRCKSAIMSDVKADLIIGGLRDRISQGNWSPSQLSEIRKTLETALEKGGSLSSSSIGIRNGVRRVISQKKEAFDKTLKTYVDALKNKKIFTSKDLADLKICADYLKCLRNGDLGGEASIRVLRNTNYLPEGDLDTVQKQLKSQITKLESQASEKKPLFGSPGGSEAVARALVKLTPEDQGRLDELVINVLAARDPELNDIQNCITYLKALDNGDYGGREHIKAFQGKISTAFGGSLDRMLSRLSKKQDEVESGVKKPLFGSPGGSEVAKSAPKSLSQKSQDRLDQLVVKVGQYVLGGSDTAPSALDLQECIAYMKALNSDQHGGINHILDNTVLSKVLGLSDLANGTEKTMLEAVINRFEKVKLI